MKKHMLLLLFIASSSSIYAQSDGFKYSGPLFLQQIHPHDRVIAESSQYGELFDFIEPRRWDLSQSVLNFEETLLGKRSFNSDFIKLSDPILKAEWDRLELMSSKIEAFMWSEAVWSATTAYVDVDIILIEDDPVSGQIYFDYEDEKWVVSDWELSLN